MTIEHTPIPTEFNKGNDPENPVPSYPLTKDEVTGTKTQFHSPCDTKHYEPQTPAPTSTYADAFEVAEAVKQTMLRNWPDKYAKKHNLGDGVSEILKRAGVQDSYDLARLVHMDKPTDLYFIVEAWVKDQAGIKKHTEDGNLTYTPFLEQTVGDLADAVHHINANMVDAFHEKWYWGVSRPEEVLGYNVSIYSEGCPNHPSYPAGHGTVAGTVCELILRKWKLSRKQREEVILACRQFAHGRTFAGVHYAEDNEVGYELGRQLVAKHYCDPLPEPEADVPDTPEVGPLPDEE